MPVFRSITTQTVSQPQLYPAPNVAWHQMTQVFWLKGIQTKTSNCQLSIMIGLTKWGENIWGEMKDG